jgi:hypothetical protein
MNNVWGEDHPEKLTSTQPKTVGIKKQLGGLFNLEQIFHSSSQEQDAQHPSPPERKSIIRSNETLVFSYIQRKEDTNVQKETQVLLHKLKEQIVVLEKSEQSLSAELSKVKVEQMPQKTGIYYLRYLEWLLTVVRQLQIKVSEGRAWLNEFSNRQKKKMGYWKKYKKHGTTFGLSHERTVATQTG